MGGGGGGRAPPSSPTPHPRIRVSTRKIIICQFLYPVTVFDTCNCYCFIHIAYTSTHTHTLYLSIHISPLSVCVCFGKGLKVFTSTTHQGLGANMWPGADE